MGFTCKKPQSLQARCSFWTSSWSPSARNEKSMTGISRESAKSSEIIGPSLFSWMYLWGTGWKLLLTISWMLVTGKDLPHPDFPTHKILHFQPSLPFFLCSFSGTCLWTTNRHEKVTKTFMDPWMLFDGIRSLYHLKSWRLLVFYFFIIIILQSSTAIIHCFVFFFYCFSVRRLFWAKYRKYYLLFWITCLQNLGFSSA